MNVPQDRCECGRPIGPSKKELKTTRKVLRQIAEEDIRRIHNNVLAHRPKWLPTFLWVKMVKIVLAPNNGRDGQ